MTAAVSLRFPLNEGRLMTFFDDTFPKLNKDVQISDTYQSVLAR